MAEPVKVLVVDGFSNHDWQHTTEVIRGLLADTNCFAVSVSTYATEDWSPGFSDRREGQFGKAVEPPLRGGIPLERCAC